MLYLHEDYRYLGLYTFEFTTQRRGVGISIAIYLFYMLSKHAAIQLENKSSVCPSKCCKNRNVIKISPMIKVYPWRVIKSSIEKLILIMGGILKEGVGNYLIIKSL